MRDEDELPTVIGWRYCGDVRTGTVVDRWDCPVCDRTFDVVFRPGRPRLYCSHACRQRAYRWRRRYDVHTVTTPGVRSPGAVTTSVWSRLSHAVRTERDPMSRRRDRRGREVTVCGALARPSTRPRGGRPAYAGYRPHSPTACRTCAAFTVPRPDGLVPPGAWTPRPDPCDPLDPPDVIDDVFVQVTAWRAAQYRPGPAPGCRDPDSPGAPPDDQPGRR